MLNREVVSLLDYGLYFNIIYQFFSVQRGSFTVISNFYDNIRSPMFSS